MARNTFIEPYGEFGTISIRYQKGAQIRDELGNVYRAVEDSRWDPSGYYFTAAQLIELAPGCSLRQENSSVQTRSGSP
jgi:hypothetical protein